MPQWRKFHLKIIDSPDVNAMPDDFTRYQWALLSLIVDKEGRGVYKGSWLKSKMYPMRDNVSPNRVMKAMEWYAGRGMVVVYSANGQEYFYVSNFHEYQSTEKEGKSQLPPPPPMLAEQLQSNSRPTPEQVQRNSVTEKRRVDVEEDIEKRIEGANAPTIPPEKAGGHGKKQGEYLDHPAVVLYRDKMLITPNPAGRRAIAEKVTDLKRWEKTLDDWIINKWNPQNLASILDRYSGSTSKNGKPANDDLSAIRSFAQKHGVKL